VGGTGPIIPILGCGDSAAMSMLGWDREMSRLGAGVRVLDSGSGTSQKASRSKAAHSRKLPKGQQIRLGLFISEGLYQAQGRGGSVV
jgi:hypothetical protein